MNFFKRNSRVNPSSKMNNQDGVKANCTDRISKLNSSLKTIFSVHCHHTHFFKYKVKKKVF